MDDSNDLQGMSVAEFATDFVAGLLGGSAGLIVGHPFDTLKVLLQTSKDNLPMGQCVKMIMRQEGARGFFKGMSYPLASVGFLNSLFFGFNMIAKATIISHTMDPSIHIMLAGAIAGGIQAIPCTPIELVKVKLQTQLEDRPGRASTKYSGPKECIRDICRRHGLRGCFRGITPTIARDITGFAVYMSVYQHLCDFGTPDGQVMPPFYTMLMAGGIAGVLSWAINFPIDTIKSLMQQDNLSNPQYRNTWNCLTKSVGENGMFVLWKGFGPALMRAFPLNAVTLCTYDWTQRHMKLYLKANANTDSASLETIQ